MYKLSRWVSPLQPPGIHFIICGQNFVAPPPVHSRLHFTHNINSSSHYVSLRLTNRTLGESSAWWKFGLKVEKCKNIVLSPNKVNGVNGKGGGKMYLESHTRNSKRFWAKYKWKHFKNCIKLEDKRLLHAPSGCKSRID